LILQIGAFFGNLLSGIGTVAGQVFQSVLPGAVNIGQQFLQREVNRKLRRRQRQQVGAQATQALNTPGIAVARIGGIRQHPSFTCRRRRAHRFSNRRPSRLFEIETLSAVHRSKNIPFTWRNGRGQWTRQTAWGSRRTEVRQG